MTTLQLIDNVSPQLYLKDTIEKALQIMNEFKATHLPVVNDEKFSGLISEEDLTNEEDRNATLELLQSNFLPAGVNGNSHFLKAAAVANLYHTNVIAVTGDNNELQGTISLEALMSALGSFCGSSENEISDPWSGQARYHQHASRWKSDCVLPRSRAAFRAAR